MLLRFFHKVPTFRLLVLYLSGAVLLLSCQRLAWSLISFGVWGLVTYGYLEEKMANSWNGRWIPGLCIAGIWLSLGAFSAWIEQRKAGFPPGHDEKVFSWVRIETVPVEKNKSFQMQVAVIHSSGNGWEGKKLLIYLGKDERSGELVLGDRLFLCMKPRKLEPGPNASGFDYAGWLHRKGICGTAYVAPSAWKRHGRASWLDVSALAERMRTLLLDRFTHFGISGTALSLVSALTLGSVHLLTPDTKQQFSVSGISHILSVSGLHVAIVYALLEFVLSFFNRFEKIRVIRQLFIIVLLWFYAFMTGLSPSVVRSALMFSLLAMGGCLHRKTQTINTVLFSAFVLLLWKPSLLYDLGFELSYLAVISIVVFHAPLTALWKPASKATDYLWKMSCLSTVAQLGTAPLTIYHFHQFPNYFLLNNLVAVPASSLIIYLAFAFLFLNAVPYLNVFLAWCLNGSLQLFQWFVKTTSEIPFALTQNLEIRKIEVLFLYILMGALFAFFFLKRRKWIFLVFFCLLFLQATEISRYFMDP